MRRLPHHPYSEDKGEVEQNSFSSRIYSYNEYGDPFDYSKQILAFETPHLNEEIEGVQLYQENYTKEKIKTLTVALVICLNIDIESPDVQRIPPYCRVQAWFDPSETSSLRALETIGKNLQLMNFIT
ncbi:unnamed protein product [Protopolystoma xenopodis]|uniref:Raptor N-terminal CASPase-like domain-containing protein n=1 Tax=Protopolystoma xenopodis TaxID=117903 RepID=A0A3S5C2K3_9PLAT|nr:unnamed protein product [Protopolystoma xenopodis]